LPTPIAFVLIFGLLVFVHELGHLIFAKRAGILCREFAIGFGPKVFSFTKNETVYTIRLLPLGGFVRMAGEDPEMIEVKPGQMIGLKFNDKDEVNKIIIINKDEHPDATVVEVERIDLEHKMFVEGYEASSEEGRLERFTVSDTSFFVNDGEEVQIAPYKRQFGSKTLGQRAMAIFAGPMMNFVLAFFLFAIIGVFQGYTVDKPIMGEITSDGAAQEAGLQEGDVVKAIDGESVSSWTDVVSKVVKHPGEEVTFDVERNGQAEEINVTPKSEKRGEETVGVIGVYQPVEKSFFGAIANGVTETLTWTKEIVLTLGKLVTGQFSIDMLSGPVGIYVSTEQVAQSGFYYLMKWAAALSINLGIVNLLPLPALDGGRLLFFLVEALRGKPIDRQKEGIVHFIGFALLMLLMLVVTWNDIQRFFVQ
jgi:regulator of sigma E protease